MQNPGIRVWPVVPDETILRISEIIGGDKSVRVGGAKEAKGEASTCHCHHFIEVPHQIILSVCFANAVETASSCRQTMPFDLNLITLLTVIDSSLASM